MSAVKAFQDHRKDRSEQTWWSWLFSSDAGVDHVELKPEGGFRRGERWTGVSTGIHHLLAVTNKGRTFSLPLSPSGNSHRQLGTRQDLAGASAPGASEPVRADELPAEVDPRFAPALHEIKSLSGIDIAQVAASDRTSFVRTPGGRVLGFGANESGQIGLGGSAAVEIVQTPVEVVLARNYPGGTMVKALDVIAGGSTTMFVVERESPGQQGKFVDLLACGNGMSGALGNGLWSSASSVPTRVKTVSGLQECEWLSSCRRGVYADGDSLRKGKGVPPFGAVHRVRVALAKRAHLRRAQDGPGSRRKGCKGRAVRQGRHGLGR